MVMRDQAANIATVTAMHTTGSVRLIRIETRTRNFKVLATTEMHTNKCRHVKERAKRRVNSSDHGVDTPLLVSLLQNRIALNPWPLC